MIAVLQRVSHASVSIAGRVSGEIGPGLLVLLGVGQDDGPEDVEWLAPKIANMRIFSDQDGKMNRSVIDIGGQTLLVSQFTLHASTKKGNRPSFISAAKPDLAVPLYEAMTRKLSELIGQPTQTGEFGADMQVSLLNDGPVTILIDTKDRK